MYHKIAFPSIIGCYFLRKYLVINKRIYQNSIIYVSAYILNLIVWYNGWMRILRFMMALVRGAKYWFSTGRFKAPEEIVLKRILTCVRCPNYAHDGFPVCKVCTCYLDPNQKPFDFVPAKTEMASESCPLGKWDAMIGKHTRIGLNIKAALRFLFLGKFASCKFHITRALQTIVK